MARRRGVIGALASLASRGAGGSLGGSLVGRSRARSWIAVAGWGLRGVRRFTGRRELVQRFKLRPGETIEISHLTELHGEADITDRKSSKKTRNSTRG